MATAGVDSTRQVFGTKGIDPLVTFHFVVKIESTPSVTGMFTECSGLGSEHDVVEVKATTDKGLETVIKVPGRLKWENIVLKRGITSDMSIWQWRQKIITGKVSDSGVRATGIVTMHDQAGQEVAKWEFKNGWPTKVSGPQMKSDSNEIGVEELTITHEYIERVN